MKFIRTLMGLLALIMMGFMFSATYAQQVGAEVSAQRPNTEIAVIHFRGGRLVQSTEQYGRWFEKRNNGVINYEFFETASTAESIELTGPNGQVKLFVDFANKTIMGQWPGQVPKVIYTITKVEAMVFTQTPVVQPPVVTPPSRVPPVVTPAINPSAPQPKDLMSATYAGGQFMQVSESVWEQSTATGEMFHFQVVGYDDHSLYLYDVSRQTFVTLEPRAKRSRMAVGGDYLRPFQTLNAVSGQRQTPIPPMPNGTLSQAEKVSCVQNGGFVERAGLLGAERCTTPFSDGGLVCTDSAQCQGQCRGDLNSAVGTSVAGVCQANDNPFGCFSEVVNGQAGPGLCVD